MRYGPIARGAGVVLLLVMGVAGADPAGDAERGEATRFWLQLQRSGQEASTTERPMPGEVAERVYQRYLESFTHPIPSTFEREDGFTAGQ